MLRERGRTLYGKWKAGIRKFHKGKCVIVISLWGKKRCVQELVMDALLINIIVLCFKMDGIPQGDVFYHKDVCKDVLQQMWATINDRMIEVSHIPNIGLNIEFPEVMFYDTDM